MFTNQKVLGVLLIIFLLGAGVYFTVSRFKQDVGTVVASPSPSPSDLDFLLTKTPVPANGQPQSAELPLAKNKKLSQFPGNLQPQQLQNKKKKLIFFFFFFIEFFFFYCSPLQGERSWGSPGR